MNKTLFAILFAVLGAVGVFLTFSSFFLGAATILDGGKEVTTAFGASTIILYLIVVIQIIITFLHLKKTKLSPFLSLIGITYFIPFFPSWLAMLPIYIIGLAAKKQE